MVAAAQKLRLGGGAMLAAALLAAPVAAAEPDWPKPCTVSSGLGLNASDAARLAGLEESRRAGLGAVAEEGKSDAAVLASALYAQVKPLAAPVPGIYRCRTLKLGGKQVELTSVVYGYFACTIAAAPGGSWTIAKTTGSQNFRGSLTPAGDGLVYKGASNYGYEAPRRYGDDADENQVGCMYAEPERRHYILELPSPRLESLHDVIELVPGK